MTIYTDCSLLPTCDWVRGIRRWMQWRARKRAPLNPAVYSQLGAILFTAGQPDDAATAVMEGMLVNSSMDLRRQLIELYGTGFEGTQCAVTAGANGQAINPVCALVHKNLCEASVDAVRIRLQTGGRDAAVDLKRSFLNDYGCPVGPLNRALPDRSGVR